MLVPKHTLTYNLVGDFPLNVHHEFEHFIVGRPWKQDFPRVYLVDGTADGEHVYGVVIPDTNDWNIRKAAFSEHLKDTSISHHTLKHTL